MASEFKVILKFLTAVVTTTNKKNIKSLQEKYKASKERLVCFNIANGKGEQRDFHFQVKNGKLKFFRKPDNDPDIVIYTSTDSILNIIDGRKKVLDHRTNTIKFEPYNFYTAFNMGDFDYEGDASIADIKIALKIFDDNIDEQREAIRSVRKEV